MFGKLFGFKSRKEKSMQFLKEGKVLIKKEAYKESIEVLRKALNFDNTNHEIYTEIGNAYFGMEDFSNATKNFLESWKINKDNPKVLGLIGVSKCNEGKGEEGVTILEEYINLEKNNHLGWEFLGKAYLNVKKFKKADYAYSNALDFDGKKEVNILAIATYFVENHEYKIGLKYAEKAAVLYRTNQAKWILAICYFGCGKPQKALELYLPILEEYKNLADSETAQILIQTQIGHCYYVLNLKNKALEYFICALKQTKEDDKKHYWKIFNDNFKGYKNYDISTKEFEELRKMLMN